MTLVDYAFVVFAINLDGDGDVDALSENVAWYESDCATHAPSASPAPTANPAPTITAAPTPRPTVSCASVSFSYENDGSQFFAERIIKTLAYGAFSVFAIDVDGDGDVDVPSADAGYDTVAWYENDGSQSFTERAITTLADEAYSVFAMSTTTATWTRCLGGGDNGHRPSVL
ncbi:hypothetical protein JL720_8546 [Aureococcus anophagefferens]|nr:hypothetical protein JL720_8546 [Aureococcus anophagefferens]